MLRFLSFFGLLLVSTPLFAQPANDNCANATSLIVGTECTPQNFTSIGATSEPTTVAANPNCGLYSGGDVWFTFEVPASGDFRIQITSSGNNAQWALYSGSCGNFVQETCATVINQLNQNFNRDDLANQTVYLRVWRFNNAAGIDFALCVREIERPANDDCANAIALPVGTSCIPETFTTEFATTESTSVVGNPSCSVFAGNDIWFSLEVPASGNFRIQASGTSVQWELYSGSCGALSSVACASSNPQLNQNFIRPDLAGTTLLLRAFRFNSTTAADYSFCVQEITPIANDNCINALGLPVSAECTAQSFTTEFATSDPPSTAPNPACGVYQGNDVWFTFDTPISGNFRIQMTTPGLNAQWQLYTGTCGNFTPVVCASATDQLSQNFANPSLGGQTLYLRVWRFNSSAAANFDLCIVDITPPQNDNCIDAIAGVVQLNCNYVAFSGQLASTEPGIAPTPSCGLFQGGDVWFTFTSPTSGQFAVDVQHLSGPTTYFAIYSGNCGALTEIACSAAGQANFNDIALGAQQFYLRVWAFNSIQGSQFELCAINTTVAPNDNCVDAIPLTVNTETCILSEYNNLGATNEPGVAPAPSCGVYLSGDVWFTFEVPQDLAITVRIDGANNSNYQGAIYSGTCGNLTEEYCIGLSGGVNIINSGLEGETLYLRVWRFNSTLGGSFDVCVGAIDCAADFNFDGLINATDLAVILSDIGCTGSCAGDINADGLVNGSDIGIFLSLFGSVCEP